MHLKLLAWHMGPIGFQLDLPNNFSLSSSNGCRDGWMSSPTWWTWVWVSSGRWWRSGKPGVLQSMGCKELDTTEWLNNNNIVEMIITISLVILYHHIKLQNVQHKLLYMLYIISPRHLFYNWKLVPLDPLHPFCPASLSSSNHHPTVYIHIEFAFVMFCLFICFNC